MSKEPTSSIPRRTARDVQQEIVLGLQRLDLSNDIEFGQVVAMGGYADVYEGTLLVKKTNQRVRVAAKKIRCMLKKEKEFAKAFARELCIWARFDHENILPLIGIAVIEGVPVLASEWMDSGTMNEYLSEQDDVDILTMVQGIARGLEYLHDLGVVHGDLRGDNVLIAHDGRPVLSDFGVSRLLVNSMTIAGTTSLKGVMRWMAPELVVPSEGVVSAHPFHTKETDVWAFGLVIYEAMAGNIPFYAHSDAQVVVSIMSKKLPGKPESRRIGGGGFELLWRCCNACWDYNPASRPTMAGVRDIVEVREPVKRTFDVVTVSNIKSIGMCWLSPTGRFLAKKSGDEKSLLILDSRTMNRCGPGLRVNFKIGTAAWSSAEDHIVTSPRKGILRKWTNVLESPTLVAQSSQKNGQLFLEFSPDDRFIASVKSGAKLWDASNLSLIWEYPGDWYYVSFHPLGNRLFFYGYSAIEVNIEDLNEITTTERDINYAFQLVFSPNGNACVTRTEEGVKFHNTYTFEEKSPLPSRYNDCRAVQITPNGKYILMALKSKKLVLWDIESQEAVEELSMDVDEYVCGEFSSNGCVLHVWMGDNEQFVHLSTTYY